MSRAVKIFMAVVLGLAGCATRPKSKDIIPENESCQAQLERARQQDIETRLNSTSLLFQRSCYQEVIVLASEIREKNRDKFYSISKEASEAVVYEGVATEYTLDAHERIFLSLLIAMSYMKLGKKSEAEISLNKTYEESVAQIHSSGTDEVTVFFQALLWNYLVGYNKAEPFFRKIQADQSYSPNLKIFVERNLDRWKRSKEKFQISGVGKIPELSFDWIGTYNPKYERQLTVKNCISEQSLLLETSSWLEQIKRRDSSEQDAAINYKRAARLPATVVYSAFVLAVGAGLTIAAGNSQAAGYLAILTVLLTYRTFVSGLAPDMRSWYELPAAFMFSFSSEAIKSDPCMRHYHGPTYEKWTVIEL